MRLLFSRLGGKLAPGNAVLSQRSIDCLVFRLELAPRLSEGPRVILRSLQDRACLDGGNSPSLARRTDHINNLYGGLNTPTHGNLGSLQYDRYRLSDLVCRFRLRYLPCTKCPSLYPALQCSDLGV